MFYPLVCVNISYIIKDIKKPKPCIILYSRRVENGAHNLMQTLEKVWDNSILPNFIECLRQAM